MARLLGCSRWSIRRLIAAGRLTSRRLLGGLIRYDRVEVEALLAGAQEDGE
ncbi:MAG TPA: helix-turn-helix domain-containing protein [Verrucomicrobiota bacterium]|nr:helix-turn-helix domain-containing protein [Verrucomicrobiota bacterium]